MRNKFITMALAGVLLLAACHRTPDEAVPLHRFEKVLFDTPADQLPARLAEAKSGEFGTDLLTLYPDDPAFMEMLAGFVQDPVMRDIYRITDSLFGDMQEESHQLGSALAKARELLPEARYDKVYTYVSGSFDYSRRVVCNSHELMISLDQYAIPCMQHYEYFNTPLYLVLQSRRQYLPTDCMTAIARERIVLPEQTLTLLDYLIAEGKAVYFAQQTLPGAADSLLLRYTSAQLEWIEQNEENVWGYFLQNNLLYETDYMRFHNFIDDAPKTNAFRESCPRTTDYIGWRIVSMYAKNTGCTMQELFDQSDAQEILARSGYRPKRH